MLIRHAAAIATMAIPGPTFSIANYQITQKLYEGNRTEVYQAVRQTDQQTVVLKLLSQEYPNVNELLHFRNQYVITRHLNHPGILPITDLVSYGNSYGLVMEDIGGLSLQAYRKQQGGRVSLTEGLAIAIQLADALNYLSQQRIIHKDIKPANILIHPQSKQAKLIDFSIATLLPKETQELKNPNSLEGTLAYLAPEQTGRMNRGIDYRTDFYGLGVTLYELLTGKLPFQADDPLELIHCHIVQLPVPPDQINPDLPAAVSGIILKLMAKNAEDRYQSALGLKHDLEYCLHQWKETGNLPEFTLGQRDLNDHFLIPEKLYGRSTEVKTLLDAFDRVAQGSSEMMLVAGFSGIGKTAVVNEVHKPITGKHGYFIKGKFDQFNRNTPLSAFVQALRSLMGQLLSESDSQLTQWRNQILAAVGEQGQVLIEVIPELERVIGQPPPAPELSGTAAQQRFNSLFQKFIAVFTTIEHPLVIFLDDLQWADAASLQLMKLLMADEEHLLLLGAYRDNEVSPTHPLMLTVEELEESGLTIHTLTLKPLALRDINQMVADTLRCSAEQAQPLTELIARKTQGNPFFTTQFLKALHDNGQINFNRDQGHWECDITQINLLSLSDDVVAFMTQQLQKLPAEAQQMLKLAACIGNQFDLTTLAIVSEQSLPNTATALWEVLQEGLILPTTQTYKFFQGDDLKTNEPASTINLSYRFLHDRVQQAAYQMIPEADKQLTHLTIGQLLLQNTDESQQQEKLFEIVNQLNHGITLLTETDQRQQYARLNLKAGCKAKEATAYSAALHYLETGMQVMQSEGWTLDAPLMHHLYEEAAEVALLNSEFETMETFIQTVLEQTDTLLEQVKVYEVRLQACKVQNQQLQAIQTGWEILQKLGVVLPASVTPAETQQRVEQTLSALLQQSNGAIANLANLSPMQDANAQAALRIMTSLVPSVHQAAPHLFPILACEEVNLSLQSGNSPFSAPGYADFGIIVSTVLNQLEIGYQLGQLALRIMEQFDERSVQSMVQFKVAAFNQANQQSLQQAILLLKESYKAGLETGDSVHTLVSTSFRLIYTYLGGVENLADLLEEVALYQSQFSTSQHFLSWAHIVYYSVKNLIESEDSLYLGSSQADEEQLLSVLLKENDELTLHLFYLCKLILSYTFGQFSVAIQDAEKGTKYLKAGLGMPTTPIYCYYDSLARLTHYSSVNPSEQAHLLTQVEHNQQQLKLYAEAAPMNYQQKYHLVEALRFHCLDNKLDAIESFDQAITEAKKNGYPQDEALANELAARFYLDWGKEKIAACHLQEAYYCYAKWGAQAKSDQLEKRYPNFLRSILQPSTQPTLNPFETLATLVNPYLSVHHAPNLSQAPSTNINTALDFAAVLKASQALSGTIQLDQLLGQLTQIILQHSGSDRCALILPDSEDNWQVRAIATPNQLELCADPLVDNPNLPVKLIQYVKNTQEVVIVDNLNTDLPIIDDYLSQRQPKSLLCLPLINQGHLIGILYLKNRAISGVFTQDRILIINFLCTQAAISLENARLYQNSQQALHKILQQEAQYRGIFEAVSDGLAIVNLNSGKLVAANPAYCQMHGYTFEELFFLEPSKILKPAAYAKYAEFLTVVQEGQVFICEAICQKKDGTVFRAELHSVPFQYGEEPCGLTVLRDVTERRQLEQVVQEKNQTLEKMLTELQQAQMQVVQSEKMSALGNLVAGVAHEINNPIGFLNGSINNAKDYVEDLLGHLRLYQQYYPQAKDPVQENAEEIDLDFLCADLPKLLDSMKGATDRIKAISTSLRTFSRADTEYKVSANLHEGLDSTLLILKYRLKANDQRPAIEIVKDYGELPLVDCFPGQLNQVFMNILANAIDVFDEAAQQVAFTDLKTKPQKITIQTAAHPEQNLVEIRIRDNGQGMTEEVKARIFDHLFTTKNVGKGTGLGLSIARQIVTETHDGILEVQSEVGQGTEFIIQLPIRE